MRSPPKRSAREFLDTPGQDPVALARLLNDIRRTNRWFGGYPLVLTYLRRVVRVLSHRPITLLDVATAGADVPRAIAAWARRQQIPLRIVALDLSEEILAQARRRTDAYPEITLLRGNALALPFPDRAVDVVICGLALHHFPYDEAVRVLREIARVARHGFIVNDILRSWGAYLGVWLDTRLLSHSRLARHDGPLSVLRSFTVDEFRAMVTQAGLSGVDVRRHPMFRVALIRWPPTRDPPRRPRRARGGARERGIPHAGPAGSGRSAGTRNCVPTGMSFDADIIVVGAGPAGSTVAMLLAAGGAQVRALDRATVPRDNPCGDDCTPRAVGP